jgi:hypothetical protein
VFKLRYNNYIIISIVLFAYTFSRVHFVSMWIISLCYIIHLVLANRNNIFADFYSIICMNCIYSRMQSIKVQTVMVL